MLKIALVHPNVVDENLTPPLGILYIASVLHENGYNVKFFDQRVNPEIYEDIVAFSPDVLGITCVTGAYNNGRLLAKRVKEKLRSVFTVFGGPHPSAIPEDILKEEYTDFVIVGEGEIPMRDLCREIASSTGQLNHQRIDNLYYKTKDGKINHTIKKGFLSNERLDELPYPAWELVDVEKYFEPSKSYGLFVKGKRNLPVMTSRGCPSACTYCCRVMGYKFRYRSSQKVLEEIHFLCKRYTLDEIHIVDDNFTINKDRAIEILDGIKKLGIYLKFPNGIRIDTVDYELLQKMKEAGSYNIGFGIESGSLQTLKKMQKKLSLEKVRENVKLAKSLGFLISANCIIGYPGETISDVRESINFFLDLDFDTISIAPLVPFPGTEVRRICEEKGYLTEAATNWDNYVFALNDPVPLVSTEFLSDKNIRKIIKETNYSFYFRPSKIYTILRNSSARKILSGVRIMLKSFKP